MREDELPLEMPAQPSRGRESAAVYDEVKRLRWQGFAVYRALGRPHMALVNGRLFPEARLSELGDGRAVE